MIKRKDKKLLKGCHVGHPFLCAKKRPIENYRHRRILLGNQPSQGYRRGIKRITSFLSYYTQQNIFQNKEDKDEDYSIMLC